MVKVPEKSCSNSAKFGWTCSKNNEMSVVGGYFDRLPCEILHNIVLMLPFASIIQLRCTSKFLYNRLTDTKFVDLQLTQALQKPPCYLFSAYDDDRRNYGMYAVEQSSGGDLTILTTSMIFKYSNYAHFQSSGGLMCLYSRESACFRVFNPHIAEEVRVSDVPIVKGCSNFKWWCFAYSPSTKEYKILKIGALSSEDETGDTVLERHVAGITTLGSNFWREVQNVPTTLSFDLFTECQGKLFWRTTMYGLILLFDLVSENFQEIPGPPRDADTGLRIRIERRDTRMSDKLINMGRTIGYVRNCRLWVLEDITRGIWIKKFDFSTYRIDMYADGLIGISGNGGLFGFIEDSTSVFSQDTSATNFRAIKTKLNEYLGNVSPEMISFIAPHVRSLVSPVRVMEMGNSVTKASCQRIYDHSEVMDISLKRKWVLETLKLDRDASEDDLFEELYKFMREYEEERKLKRQRVITMG